MAPTAAAKKPAAAAGKDKKPKMGRPRNYDLGNGIVRFSRARMYHKKALWKFVGKKATTEKKAPKPTSVEKKINGDKNGGKRVVSLLKRRAHYSTQDKVKKRPAKKTFKQHARYLRSTITPGTVCILLAGAHKGKRVVFLKQLHSGLLLVNGPFKVNACPLRRINQRYVIATETKVNIDGMQVPDHINDDYFARERKKRAKKEEGDIFQKKKESYKASEQRRADQKVVDKALIAAIKKTGQHKMLFPYLATMFGLRSSQYPHRMKF